MVENENSSPAERETWPTDGTNTFEYPPLESARPARSLRWRGVRLGAIVNEIYYENEDVIPVMISDNLCARTGKPPPISPQAKHWLYLNAPQRAIWKTMATFSNLSVVMGVAIPEASELVKQGLTNAVPLADLAYSAFHIPEPDEKDPPGFDHTATLTIAVSYTHSLQTADGLLKANPFQIAQLEDIFETLQEHPPSGLKFVRLWTDQALSQRLRGVSERPSWILYGLIPYAVFVVAVLHSEANQDSSSMWSACEQLLGDGGFGCLFSFRTCQRTPEFCKQEYSIGGSPFAAAMAVGDGLSINRNITKLCGAIHTGLLDNTITFHIADAQNLFRLAYYMMRMSNDVTLMHAVNCEPCLNMTFREHVGFLSCVAECADAYNTEKDTDLARRLRRTANNFRYPKMRASKGYVDWHGMREFVPGAGKFAKSVSMEIAERFREYVFVVKFGQGQKTRSDASVAISARPVTDQLGTVRYLVLLVVGADLFGKLARVDYTMRLNIADIEKLHACVQARELDLPFKTFFRHPELSDEYGEQLLCGFNHISSVLWGKTSEKYGAAIDLAQKMSSIASKYLKL